MTALVLKKKEKEKAISSITNVYITPSSLSYFPRDANGFKFFTFLLTQ